MASHVERRAAEREEEDEDLATRCHGRRAGEDNGEDEEGGDDNRVRHSTLASDEAEVAVVGGDSHSPVGEEGQLASNRDSGATYIARLRAGHEHGTAPSAVQRKHDPDDSDSDSVCATDTDQGRTSTQSPLTMRFLSASPAAWRGKSE